MPGILIMGAITLAAATVVWAGLLYYFSGRQKRYLLLLLPELPLSFVVNLLVKKPLALGAAQMAGIEPLFRLDSPLWYLALLTVLAPLTEEAIKVTPLLLPVPRRIWGQRRLPVSTPTALWVGMGLGIGFGLSEVIYLAFSFSRSPAYIGFPWYLFSGFFGERMATVFAHGMMTTLFVYGLSQGWKKGVLGYLAAAGMHAFVNLGAVLYNLKLVNVVVTQVPFVLSLLVLLVIFEHLRRETVSQPGMPQTEQVIFERPEETAESIVKKGT